MAITMDGIYVNGQKVTFHPENILSGDASAYTEEIGTAVEEWLEGNVTGGEQVTDTTLTLPGVPADAKKVGDDLADVKAVLNAGKQYSLTWEQGGLNNSGNKSSSNYDIRVRSTSYVDIIDDSIAIVVPQGYKLLIHVYDRTNGTSHLGYLPSADDITDNAEFTISAYYPNATHLKFVLGKVDNSNVSPTIAELYKFTTKLNNITRLTDEINNTKNNVARNTANIPVSAFLSAINRMCVCGASWDSGYVYTEQGSTIENLKLAWGYQLSKKYGFSFVCSARHSLYTKTWLTSPYGIAYINKNDPCDLYVLTFGGNDSKQGTEYLGALEDITSHESYDDYADSFYGNYGRIVEQIKEHAPNALIVCGMYNDGTTARNQYYTALQNICEHYHILVFNWYEDEWYRTYLQDNLVGSHPTATLHSGIALAFERIYNNLVVDNYDYFKFLRTKDNSVDELTCVKSDINDLKEDLNSIYHIDTSVDLSWNQGTIKGDTGTASPSSTRCYTNHVLSDSDKHILHIPAGQRCYVYEYTSASSAGYIGAYTHDWVTGEYEIFIQKGHYIRLVCAYVDSASITPSDVTDVVLYCVKYTDKTLSISDAPADAKVVGDIILDIKSKEYEKILYTLSNASANLFSIYSADYLSGKGYSQNTGNIVNAVNNCISGYIPVKNGDYFKVMVDGKNIFNTSIDGQIRKVAYYNSSKVWQKTESYYPVETNPDAIKILYDGYIRVAFRKTDQKEIFVSSVLKDKLVDLMIFAGQSNMAGRGETSEDFPDGAPTVLPNTAYEFKAITDPTQLYPLTEPFGYAENAANDGSGIYDSTRKTGDMIPAFVNAYYAANGNVPSVCVSASEGGSSSIEWQPETGNNFVDLAARVRLAQTWLADNGYSIRHQYCVWCQGESDSDNINNGSETLDEYKARARAIWDGLIALDMEKVLLVRIGHHNSGASTRYKEIIDWQTDECKTNENLVLVSCDFAAMRAKGMMKDAFHYYQIGYNLTGHSAGVNSAFYATTGKEPTMYDPENDNLYYSHK